MVDPYSAPPLVKDAAAVLNMLRGGARALAGGTRAAAGAGGKLAKFITRTSPEASLLSGGPGAVAKRAWRAAFNPYLGRYDRPIKLGLFSGTATPLAYGAYNAVQDTRAQTNQLLQHLPDPPNGAAHELRTWTDDLTNHPVDWARNWWNGQRTPVQQGADQALWRYTKHKARNLVPLGDDWQTRALAPLRPALSALRAVTPLDPAVPPQLSQELGRLAQ